MIARRTVICLGLSQLICWGVSYYLIGIFGEAIAAEMRWTRPLVYGGFSAALVVMGVTSPLTGSFIDRYGGRRVMVAGSVLIALGCAVLAAATSIAIYYAAWLCLGVAMRLTLYEAAFASLARIGGPQARRPIAQVTLFGGLASTTFWPIGHALADLAGWRGAVLVYAGFALLTIPLHLAIPDTRFDARSPAAAFPGAAEPPAKVRRPLLTASLYATIAILASFLNSGMSAHMIPILAGLGLAASASVWIATLRGVGQSLARLSDVLFGGGLNPLQLNLIAALILPVAFAIGLLSGDAMIAAIAFAFGYGAGNGIATITRGTLPLVLFDVGSYGALTGRLLVPSFLLAALAPTGYALVIDRFSEIGALVFSFILAALLLAASLVLQALFRSGD
ncbi:MAG TPA: MFS transporter [Stellaceae bacterium]|nr:MFS transporter [Stellaceae bacterium]